MAGNKGWVFLLSSKVGLLVVAEISLTIHLIHLPIENKPGHFINKCLPISDTLLYIIGDLRACYLYKVSS